MTQANTLKANPGQGRIAIIKAGWHSAIVDKALDGFLAEATRLGRGIADIDVFQTPGAFEIPLQAQTLARTGRYAALVAVALVSDGGIYRHEFVAETVLRALMKVQLETETPTISVVLTPHHFHGHDEHQRFFEAHFVTKGAEAAQACIAAMEGLRLIRAASAPGRTSPKAGAAAKTLL